MEVEFLLKDGTIGRGIPRRGSNNVFSIPKGAVAVRVLEGGHKLREDEEIEDCGFDPMWDCGSN